MSLCYRSSLVERKCLSKYYHRMGIVTAARAVYRAGKATLVTGTILVKVIFVTIMSYRNFSGIAFTIYFRVGGRTGQISSLTPKNEAN
jgi:hypothetical protein